MKEHVVTVFLSVASTFGVMQAVQERPKVLEVDRLIVRKELIVSDTGQPWEKGFEEHQIPRGIYARSLSDGPGGLWVRSRLIKGEIDDPFDDRFHALEKDGSMRRLPDTSRGTSGSTARGGRWRSFRARGWNSPRSRSRNGRARPTRDGSAFRPSARDTASR